MRKLITIGTRKSALAMWQSNQIRALLLSLYSGLKIELMPIITKGDKSQDLGVGLPEIGGKGLFTAELEEALKAGVIDLAVHSLKDLPTSLAPDFVLGAIPKREVVEDVLISRSGAGLRELHKGAVIGTSSPRRASQLLRARPDLAIRSIRGNLDTRIRKALDKDSPYDATILAKSGLVRLELENCITEVLSLEDMLPAPGQGALGVECRADDAELLALLRGITHNDTEIAVTAERAFLATLNAGCTTPVAAYARIEARDTKPVIVFKGRYFAGESKDFGEVSGESQVDQARELGVAMAREISRVASEIKG